MAQKTLTITNFKGLNNQLPPEALIGFDKNSGPYAYLQRATNIDIDDSDMILRRQGSTPLLSGNIHSLWSNEKICLYRESTLLKRLFSDWSTATLATGLLGNQPMSYYSVNDRVYYSDGISTGVVDSATGLNRTWGLEVPKGFKVSTVVGDLQAGRYLVSLTYVRDDGQESGASPAVMIETNGTQGILISDIPIPNDSSIFAVTAYISTTNGMVLYRIGSFSINIGSAVIRYDRSVKALSLRLLTQGLDKAPSGTIVSYWNGRMLIAKDNILWRSEPYAFELFDYMNGFNRFDSPIQIVAPVVNGIFVGTMKQILFLHGVGSYGLGANDPEKFRAEPVAPYGAIKGTLQTVNLDIIGNKEAEGMAQMFLSQKGIVLGQEGGKLENLSQERYIFPASSIGSALFRHWRTTYQYLVLMKQGSYLSANLILPSLSST